MRFGGSGAYQASIAGGMAFPSLSIGLLLYMPKRVDGLYTKVAGFDFQLQQLNHIIEWLGGIVIEGEVRSEDHEIADKISALHKGDSISYSLVTDKGKVASGNATLRRAVSKIKSDGRLFFRHHAEA